MNTYLYITVGMIGGLAFSGLVGFYFYRRLDSKVCRLLAVHDLSMAFVTLDLLRSDKMERAISNNEMLLDAGVVGLGRFLSKMPPHRRSLDDVFWLRKVRDYRGKFPRTSGIAEVDLGVAQALALIDFQHEPVA